MAKISTYPHASSPQLSDMLIGSEVGDGNATKNFLISDIIGLANLGQYVPYTGATSNVDLGVYDLDAGDISGSSVTAGDVVSVTSASIQGTLIDSSTSSGASGEVLTSTGSGVLWQLYGLQEVLDAGNSATGNITLVGDITAATIEGNTLIKASGVLSVESELFDQNASAGTSGQILSSTVTGVDWITYGLQNVLNAGSIATGNITITGDVNATRLISANTFEVSSGLSEFYGPVQIYNSITIDAELFDSSGNSGTAGQLLSSIGAGTSWVDIGLQEVLDTNNSATQDIYLTGEISASTVTSLSDLKCYGTLSDGVGNPGTAGQVLKSTVTGVEWADEINTAFGVFYDDSLQTCTTGTAAAMRFNTQVNANGVSVATDGSGNKTYIQVNENGVYNIQFSAQVVRITGGGAEKVDIWFRKNGTDLPWSNTQLTLQANANYLVASWNIISDINTGDNFQIMWHQTGGSIRLVADPAQTAPVRPATPSTILTVTRVA